MRQRATASGSLEAEAPLCCARNTRAHTHSQSQYVYITIDSRVYVEDTHSRAAPPFHHITIRCTLYSIVLIDRRELRCDPLWHLARKRHIVTSGKKDAHIGFQKSLYTRAPERLSVLHSSLVSDRPDVPMIGQSDADRPTYRLWKSEYITGRRQFQMFIDLL